jgi:hypothetical protein
MMLANHAETPPNGLIYVSGGAWDTVNVAEPPPEGVPPGIVAVVQGMLVIRLLFHRTEMEQDYPFLITIVDEDGAEIGRIAGDMRAEGLEDAPATWMQATNIIVGLAGLPLPRFGEYRISLQVNRDHKGEIPFRVVKRY